MDNINQKYNGISTNFLILFKPDVLSKKVAESC